MSGKSSAATQVISLPQGGGAQRGIGETFSPDLHTGTGNFTIPIALPPGRNGFQPQLNLAYSSGNGNGPCGMGWGLTIPGISRKTSKGIPHYDDAKDTFLLSGSEDLVPVTVGPGGVNHYRPRTEGLFARIHHHHDSETNYWKVWTKDGLISFYGTPESAVTDPAVVADPINRAKVFAWNLTRTIDPFGNRIEYSYERDENQKEGSHHWDQLYLSEIRYVDHGNAHDPQFLVTIRFVYEKRPDPFSQYRAGFEIRTVQRCTRIEIFTHAGESTLTRTHHLIYLDQQDLPPDQMPLNAVSLLSQVRVVGHDGELDEELPPLELRYTKFQPEKRDFMPITGIEMPPGSLARPEYELVDLMGNGLPSVFEMNGAVRYWRNLGMGSLDLPRAMRSAPAGLNLGDTGVQLIDADGDGRTDLMINSGYFPMRFGGLWDERSFHRYQVSASFNLEDPEVRLVDLDGDGVTDAIRSGTRLECFFNDAHNGWTTTRFVERRSLDDFPNVNFSDPRVKWADMSGDGLQDIVLIHDGNVEYWPSLGRGDWAKKISMRNCPRLPAGYDPKRILVGDVDGDGLSDIVYVDNSKVTLWINQCGNSWSKPIEILGTPPISDIDAVRLVDMLGNGVSGVLWSSDASSISRAQMFFFDFTGGIKPYLLSETDNNFGAITRIGYTPSTQFYLADEKRLETRWKTTLPFPVQVVARVELIDVLSRGKLTTEYSYHHGYWDGAEREFRGFGRVDQRDTEIFEDYHAPGLHSSANSFEAVTHNSFAPPTETRMWFHQGPIGDEFGEWEETDFSSEFWPGDRQSLVRPPAVTTFLKSLPRRARRDAFRALRGSVLRTELYALDQTQRQPRPYTVIENLYGVREEPSPGPEDAARSRIFFPHSLAQRTTQWERGDDPLTQFSFTDDYDEYGQVRSQINIAVPRGRDFRVASSSQEPYLATHSVTTFAQRDDEQKYIVSRPAGSTSYEILNDGTSSVFALKDYTSSSEAVRRVIGHTLHFYDGPAFQGLSFGQIGDHGALVRSESLILTDALLDEAYKAGDGQSSLSEKPPYLVPDGPLPWTADYPQEFQDLMPPLAGYTHHDGDAPYGAGYFITTERRSYDFHDILLNQRGLVKLTRDPLGSDTAIEHDAFDLLPIAVVDPLGLATKAIYDYRVLQPREVIDANDNQTQFLFTPMGNLNTVWVRGKPAENEGDRERPSLRMEYDFLSFINSQPDKRQPIFVRTVRQLHHVSETDIPLPDRDETIESVEYSDGFGRLLQTRTQAEDITFGDPVFGDAGLPLDQSVLAGEVTGQQIGDDEAPRVVVSGWQIFDNKGRVVEKYEPFFCNGWSYAPPTDEQLGQKSIMQYDPRGQLVCTVNPNKSEVRTVYGIPETLGNPERFTPTPWESYAYDVNDNSGRTHPVESLAYQHHRDTPVSVKIDALGRTVETVVRNRSAPDADNPFPPLEEHRTRQRYDVRGNVLVVIDALDREAFRHVYDLANNPLRVESIDAGVRRNVIDATGNIIEQRDSKGALVLRAHDPLRRLVRTWARDDFAGTVTLRQRQEYGDGSRLDQSPDERATNRAANRLGKQHHQYDEAGLLTFERYDFKGNILAKMRRVIADAEVLSVFTPPSPSEPVQTFRTNWQPDEGTTFAEHAGKLLDTREYRTSVTYDALNRIKAILYPRDADNERKQLRPKYNRAGALESLELGGRSYVEHIAYNAKAQRVLIAYGNGVMARHAYDPLTFRLARLRSERFTRATDSEFTFQPISADSPLQDLAYNYDLAGNILEITERVANCGVVNNPESLLVVNQQLAQLLVAGDALIRHFDYDSLYRLSAATGRECDLQPSPSPWSDTPKCQDVTLARVYNERYRFDRAGNMTQLVHQAVAGNGSFTRSLNIEAGKNRLASISIGANSFDYAYDASGNLLRETNSRHFEWDYADRMRAYRTQPAGAEPSVYAHYFYDAAGQRVKKIVRKQGGQLEVTVYVDSVFEHHTITNNGTAFENNTLHVMDNQSRIATVRVGTIFPDDATPAIKFHFGDHLGSSSLVVGEAGGLINREEYTPFGESSFGSFAKKRYRFTGKERDEESGLYYHVARYYSPWMCRWVSCDPAGTVDGLNLYAYTGGNPINLRDPLGTGSETAEDGGGGTEGGGPGTLKATDASGTSSGSSSAAGAIPVPPSRSSGAPATPRIAPGKPSPGPIKAPSGISRDGFRPGSYQAPPPTRQVPAKAPPARTPTPMRAPGLPSATAVLTAVTVVLTTGMMFSGDANLEKNQLPSMPELNELFAQKVKEQNIRLGKDTVFLLSIYDPRLLNSLMQRINSNSISPDTAVALARISYGRALERMVAEALREDPQTAPYFDYISEKSGAYKPDFEGRGPLEGLYFDITTTKAAAKHLDPDLRKYGENLIVHTYDRRGVLK